MPFVQIGHRIEFIGQIANFFHPAEITVHGINALKRDQLRAIRIIIRHQRPQMIHVVMLEDATVCT